MIFSAQQIFSDAQAITGSARSTNVIDLGERGTPYDAAASLFGDVGKGHAPCLLAQVVEDFNTLTSLTIAIETGDTDSLGTVLAEQTIDLADLVAGAQFSVQSVPVGAVGRYLGLRYTVTGTDPTEGAITAGITMGNQTNVHGA